MYLIYILTQRTFLKIHLEERNLNEDFQYHQLINFYFKISINPLP